MGKDKKGVFKLVKGLKSVDPKTLAAFEKEMTDQGITAIITDVEKRRMLAAESRQRRLEMPSKGKPKPPK